MRKRIMNRHGQWSWIPVFFIALLMLSLVLAPTGCKKKKPSSEPSDSEMADEAGQSAEDRETLDTGDIAGIGQDSLIDADLGATALDEPDLKDIHFAFDRFELSITAQTLLRENADWLLSNSSVQIVIEGHCDERGSNEYNLALGERRAESSKDFLVSLGVDSSRMRAISYGEEMPLDPRSTEEAWSKNRRAHFLVVQQ